MSNVLILANVPEMLTVLPETTEESVHAVRDLQETHMGLHVNQVRHFPCKMLDVFQCNHSIKN